MVYTEEEARRVIVRAGRRLVKMGLTARTWGNISARISDTHFAITPSGKAYETLKPEDIVVVKIEDCSYEGEQKPSSEKGIHADVYRLRGGVNFVIHTHQAWASAWSVLGTNLSVADMMASQENAPELIRILGGGIPCAAYGLSATKRLRENVRLAVEEYPESRAVLMKNHGALCMGRDEDEAFEVAETLEQVCKKQYEDRCGIIFQSELSERGSYGRSLRRGARAAFRWNGEKKIYHLGNREGRNIQPEFAPHSAIYRYTDESCVLHVRTPFVMAASMEGRTLKPYLDDQAQIAGPTIRCLPDGNFSGKGGRRLAAALKGRNAVLLRDNGAICVGSSLEDAKAVATVLEKGCQAAILAHRVGGVKPISPQHAGLERMVYQMKYSKLK